MTKHTRREPKNTWSEFMSVSSDKLAHVTRGKLTHTRSGGGQGRNLDLLVKTNVSYHSGKKKKMTLFLIKDNPRGDPSVGWIHILYHDRFFFFNIYNRS